MEPSLPFLRTAASRLHDPRVGLVAGLAERLPVATASVDAVVSGLVLTFVADRPAAVAEARRVVRPGGVVAAYVWDYADGMELLRRFWDAAVSLDPAAAALDEGVRFADCGPAGLRALLESGGLEEVEVVPVEVPTAFADADDLWAPFLRGTGPAPAYVASLGEAAREALRRELCRRLPTAADGSVHLTARAWCASGHAPSGPVRTGYAL